MCLGASSFLRRLVAFLAAGCIAAFTTHASEQVVLTFLGTTDIHGHIHPVDYYRNQPSQDGLAKISTLVGRIRAENPNVLLLDSGDTIQGTPLSFHHNRKNNTPPDPVMLAMNAIGFDAMAIGNHEFNFGLPVLEKARSEADFPWLSANILQNGSDAHPYPPYIVREVAGVRIGILGLTTPGVPLWENPENYAGLEFHDPVEAGRRWAAVLREREQVDLVVAAVHMGLDRDPETGAVWPGQIPNENATIPLADAAPGIDVIFMGHTHRNIPSMTHNGVLLTQAGRWGNHLARADVTLDRDSGRRWKVVAKTARTIPVTAAVEADPAILELTQVYHEETEAWLGQTIGASARALSAREARLRDTAIVDLIHRVQLETGNADVSMAAAFSLSASVPAGPVTVRDIAGLYIYENTLVVLEVTGAQLKTALENAARYFRPFEEGKSAKDLIDPQIPGYNFDMAEGVSYEIDLRRPYGERIVNLLYDGVPLDPARKLRLATNNYRYNGGGGYSVYREAPVVYRSSEEIRELIIEWVERNGTIPTEASGNWRILPE